MQRTPTYEVVLEPQDEGGYSAYVPELPGCVSEGETLDDAVKMIGEAIALYLETQEAHGWDLPKIERRQVAPAAL